MDAARIPDIDRLHERHEGLTPVVANQFAEAAAVCFDRFHEPPVSVAVSQHREATRLYAFDWIPPNSRQLSAWANDDDATRDGAYGIVLALAETRLGLVAVARAPTGTGPDYLLGPPGSEVDSVDGELNFEKSIRLEVSGISRCDSEAMLSYRVSEKVRQDQRADPDSPALAGVAAFNLRRVAFRRAI
jgi:hypothetical protein